MKKKRHPKPVTIPIMYRFSPEIETKLQLIPHQELDALLRGVANETAFHTLAARINVGSIAVRWHWPDNEQAMAVMDAALAALVSLGERGHKIGKWGVSGDEFKAIGAGLNLTDEAQKNLTRRQFNDVLQHVFKVAAV